MLCELGGDVRVLADVVLHRVADQRLSRQLDGSELANTLMHEVLTRVLLIDELLCE